MYQKSFEATIVRTKHRIFLHQGARAAALKEALTKVPDHAEIDEISTPDDGPAFIEFHEETRAE